MIKINYVKLILISKVDFKKKILLFDSYEKFLLYFDVKKSDRKYGLIQELKNRLDIFYYSSIYFSQNGIDYFDFEDFLLDFKKGFSLV